MKNVPEALFTVLVVGSILLFGGVYKDVPLLLASIGALGVVYVIVKNPQLAKFKFGFGGASFELEGLKTEIHTTLEQTRAAAAVLARIALISVARGGVFGRVITLEDKLSHRDAVVKLMRELNASSDQIQNAVEPINHVVRHILAKNVLLSVADSLQAQGKFAEAQRMYGLQNGSWVPGEEFRTPSVEELRKFLSQTGLLRQAEARLSEFEHFLTHSTLPKNLSVAHLLSVRAG